MEGFACLFVFFLVLLLVAAVFLGRRLVCSRDLCPLLLSLSLLQGFPFPLVSGSITTYVGMSCLWVCLLRKHTHTHRLLNPPSHCRFRLQVRSPVCQMVYFAIN